MSTDERSPSGIGFWVMFVIGLGVMAFGFREVFEKVGPNNPRYTFSLAIGLNIFHDAVIPPIACAVGWVVSRLAPARIRAQVCWGLFASAVVVLVGYAPLRGFGRHADNPSVLPLNYATALTTVLVVVWVIVALLIALPLLVRKLRNRTTPGA